MSITACRTGGRVSRLAIASVVALALIGAVMPETATAETPADALTSCWRNTALASAAANCDPAEAVVDATFHGCLQQEVTWHDALVKAGGPYGAATAQTIYTRVKQRTRTTLMSMVSKARADKGLCR